MAERDDGEFEIILGNKQLLSVLFMVIVLLGVFFAMGFLAGRSTAGGTVVAKNDKSPLPLERPAAAAPASQPLPWQEKKEAKPAAEEPAPPPVKAAEPRQVEPAKAERPAERKAETKVDTKKAEAKPEPKKAVAEPARGSAFVEAPPTGTYLQVAATRRADAESMLGYIGEKTGLRGYVAPSPKSTELFRVLIGPLRSSEDIASGRTKLADMGVKSPYIIKY